MYNEKLIDTITNYAIFTIPDIALMQDNNRNKKIIDFYSLRSDDIAKLLNCKFLGFENNELNSVTETVSISQEVIDLTINFSNNNYILDDIYQLVELVEQQRELEKDNPLFSNKLLGFTYSDEHYIKAYFQASIKAQNN